MNHRHNVITVSTRLKKPLTAVAVGIIVCLVTLALRQSGLLGIAELKTLDHRYQLYADPAKAAKDLVLVAVDEASLEAYGRWPWPRDRHGYAVQYLKEAGAKAIVFDILFLEPDDNAEEFDQSFAEQIRRAGNVFLPTLLDTTTDPTAGPRLLAKATIPVRRESERAIGVTGRYPGVNLPIPPLAEAARGLGYVNLFPTAGHPEQDLTPLREQPAQIRSHSESPSGCRPSLCKFRSADPPTFVGGPPTKVGIAIVG